MLEEYGSPDRADHGAWELPWQDTIRNTSIAADQLWQFGPANLTVNPTEFGDEFSVYYGKPEFEKVGKQHAQAMLDKKV